MGGGGEAGAVADGDQQDGGGPDADAGHRGQDLGKRVGLQQGLDLGFQGPSLFVDGGERAGQGRDHDVEGAGARERRRSARRARRRRRRSAAAAMRGALGRITSTSLRRPALRSAAGDP